MGKALFYLCTVATATWLSACGPSKLAQGLSDGATAATGNEISIWERSPTITGANVNLTAKSDLSKIPRVRKALTGLVNPQGPLSSQDLSVAQEIEKTGSLSFRDWIGREANWTSGDFAMFMAYHHMNVALTYAKSLFPASEGYDFRKSTNKLLPLKVFAKQRFVHDALTGAVVKETQNGVSVDVVGDALQTHYDPYGKQILFFGQYDTVLPNFNPVQEADAIYHEFGHVVQHMVNKSVLETSGNADIDALLEGLADYFAAAVLRDDRILTYLASNAKYLFGDLNINGASHNRQMNHSLTLPRSYTTSIHLNGRVVAGAINQFRKYLISSSVGMANTRAFDLTAQLAYRALVDISSTSSLRGYTDKLLDLCAGTQWCAAHSTSLKSILVSRGLNFNTAAPAAKPANASAINSTVLGFLPFPGRADFANTNSTLDSCEVAMIFPNLKGIDGLSIVNGRFYDSRAAYRNYVTAAVRLDSISGAGPFRYPDTNEVVEYLDPTSPYFEYKTIPWLDPGEVLQTLIRDLGSKIYTASEGSVFTQKLSDTFYPSPLGWLVRANSTGTVSATFSISLRAFNNAVFESAAAGTYISNDQRTFSIPITTVANSPLCP